MGKGRVRKAVVNRARKWSDYDRTIETTRSLKDYIRRLFIPQRSRREEDLSQAMQRLQLSQADIRDRLRSFKRLTIIMLSAAGGVLFYSICLFMQQHWLAAGLGLLITGLPLMLAFRYHFWHFQLKKGKLGCSLREWFQQGVLRR